MKQRQMVVQNPDGTPVVYVKNDVIGIAGELIGIAGGVVAGGFVGSQIWKLIGPASSTIEKVGKAFLVGSISTATEYYVSEGIAATFNDIAETIDEKEAKIRARNQQILAQAIGEEVEIQEVPAQQQGPKAKTVKQVKK